MNENNLLELSLFDATFLAGSYVCENPSVAAGFSYCIVSMTYSDTTQIFIFLCSCHNCKVTRILCTAFMLRHKHVKQV